MLVLFTSFVSGIVGVIWVRRRVRIIKLNGFLESVIWTVRSWRAGYPVPSNSDRWQSDNKDDHFKDIFAALRAWKFLGPFFASRGYAIYHSDPKSVFSLYPPAVPKAHKSPSYPYARRGYKEDSEIPFSFFVRIYFLCGG